MVNKEIETIKLTSELMLRVLEKVIKDELISKIADIRDVVIL